MPKLGHIHLQKHLSDYVSIFHFGWGRSRFHQLHLQGENNTKSWDFPIGSMVGQHQIVILPLAWIAPSLHMIVFLKIIFMLLTCFPPWCGAPLGLDSLHGLFTSCSQVVWSQLSVVIYQMCKYH